ncbi:MAG: LuxR C-terminal-related transcriptional regulator [Thermodesulfobacteriota bacterium]
MGYGKTTAVKSFLLARDNPVMWISFLASEDTAAFFWNRLTDQIAEGDPAAGTKLKNLGFPANAPQIAHILSVFNQMAFENNTVLVIDDYHLVKDRRIGQFLVSAVKEELQNFHIVVITRDITHIDFADLAAKQLCHVVSRDQLRFSDDEIKRYCALAGFTPSEGELVQISEYTGGCISLVYLILLGLEKDMPVGLNTTVYELMKKNLYDAYDERIRGFLQKLAVMDRFTPEQAAFVSGEKDAEPLLRKLYRENAFISRDETAGTYRIHNVFLDFLRTKQTDDSALRALYHRAGRWHLKQKDYQAAYKYLYRAGETEDILSLLNDETNITNAFAAFEGSDEMFAAMPPAVLFRYPLAYLQYIGILLLSGDAGAAEDGAMRLDALQKFYEHDAHVPLARKKRILAEINVIRIFAAFNEVEKMVACNSKALDLLAGGRSCLVKRESEFTFGCPHFLYAYHRTPGELKPTVDRIVSGFPAFAQIADGCGTGCEYAAPAECALETGNRQQAEENAYKAIYKARAFDQTGIIICARFTLIRLYLLEGKTAEALSLLKQLRADAEKENSVIYNTTLDMCDGYVFGCLGQIDKIPLWLQKSDLSPADLLYQGISFNCIIHGKAVLLSRNYLELEMLTETFEQHFAVFGNQIGFIHNHVFAAAAKYRLYGMAAGRRSLQKAIDIAEKDHIVLPFAEHAPAVLPLLKSIYDRGAKDDYVKTLLACSEEYMESVKGLPQSTFSLSAREREVLGLAAEGLIRDAIAERLGVSTGTVRTHLRNIYQKLEVGSKVEAIRKAQRLKLL